MLPGLAVIDVDYPSLLPELKRLLPEVEKTTRVETKRCYHYYLVVVVLSQQITF